MLSKHTAQALRKLFLCVSVLVIAGATLNMAAADKGTAKTGGNGVYSFGLWGDVPYSDLQATVGVPNLIRDMNSQDLAFTAHDGDLKAGSGTVGSVTPTICS